MAGRRLIDSHQIKNAQFICRSSYRLISHYRTVTNTIYIVLNSELMNATLPFIRVQSSQIHTCVCVCLPIARNSCRKHLVLSRKQQQQEMS